MNVECILLKIPMYGDFHIFLDEGVPMFNGKETALILGYKHPYEAVIKCVNTKDRFKRIIPNFSKSAEDTWFINIDGLLSLVLHKDCEVTKGFEDWVGKRTLKLKSFDKNFGNEGKIVVKQGQTISLFEQKLQEQENEIQDLKREVGELKDVVLKIKQQLELFTSPEEKTSEKSRILAIKEMVQKYRRLIGGEPEEIWNKVFKDLYSKYGISVDSIKEIKEDESGLSKLVRKGHLEKLEIVLFEMIRDGGVD